MCARVMFVMPPGGVRHACALICKQVVAVLFSRLVPSLSLPLFFFLFKSSRLVKVKAIGWSCRWWEAGRIAAPH